MTIPAEVQAQILRYHHVERWPPGTIARQLGVHHATVQRVLAHAGLPHRGAIQRPSMIEPYLPFVLRTLEKFPTLTAARLYAMVRERGYAGSPDHFRHRIALHRPRPAPEAYLRLRTLPGEQAQVDWAHFGHLQIGRARRALMGFVMVLSYSRQIHLRFFLDARMDSFLRGHLGAFHAWCGVPRVLLYDNLRSAVLERAGDAIRLHPTLLAFAAHYRYEPRPVAVARGNEKGRVERSIRYIREAFFNARAFDGLDDLNAQADAWCRAQAAERAWPEDRALRVREVFAREQPQLLALPSEAYPAEEVVVARVGKTPYVRFDLNDYSVPHTHVRRAVTVRADAERVRVLDGEQVLAVHRRSFDRGAQVEDLSHIEELKRRKTAARQHRGVSSLTCAAPAAQTLLERAAAGGAHIGAIVREMESLLERFGAAELQGATLEALQAGVAHPNAVRLCLERRRLGRGAPAPVAACLSERAREKDAAVRPHALGTYDQLTEETPDDDHPGA